MTVDYFFEQVKRSKLQYLDIYNFIERHTSNFNLDKLKVLKGHLHTVIFTTKECVNENTPDIFFSVYNDISEQLKNEEDLTSIINELKQKKVEGSYSRANYERQINFLSESAKSRGEEFNQRDAFLFIIALNQMAELHGGNVVENYLQLLNLTAIEIIIDSIIDQSTTTREISLTDPDLDKIIAKIKGTSNRQATTEEIKFVLIYAQKYKQLKNVSELIRIIQSSEACPGSLKDEPGSSAMAKRIRRIIKSYDKFTLNTRN